MTILTKWEEWVFFGHGNSYLVVYVSDQDPQWEGLSYALIKDIRQTVMDHGLGTPYTTHLMQSLCDIHVLEVGKSKKEKKRKEKKRKEKKRKEKKRKEKKRKEKKRKEKKRKKKREKKRPLKHGQAL
ncbi:hypothetical protein AAES_26361 [Amazona aestiva]|uniref:Uncharacterized protein n=1 Tax=Amazona aestiva TaxID=12930 RepID=A0A0Q3TBK3_AMAAE|nr:hypothetical protein AAES_26361 [Amazona aestiva]